MTTIYKERPHYELSAHEKGLDVSRSKNYNSRSGVTTGELLVNGDT